MGTATRIPCVAAMVRASKEYGASPTMWLSGLKDRCYALHNQDVDDSLFLNKEEMNKKLGLPTIGTHPSERYVACLAPKAEHLRLLVPKTAEVLGSCVVNSAKWGMPKWPEALVVCQGEQTKRFPGVLYYTTDACQHICVPVIWRLNWKSSKRGGVLVYDMPYISPFRTDRTEKDVLMYRSKDYEDAFTGAAEQAVATYMLYTAEHCNV